jgi:hypothetical protein
MKSFTESCRKRCCADREKKEDFAYECLEIESCSLPRFFVLAAFLSGCGILFTQLVVCAESDTTPHGVKVIVSLMVTAIIIGGTWFCWRALRKSLNWTEEMYTSESFSVLDDIKTQWKCCGPVQVSNGQ